MYKLKKKIYLLIFVISLVTNSNAQLIWSQKKQHNAEYQNYKKPANKWGEAVNTSDFDPVLGERLQDVLDSTMAVHNIIGTSASIIMPEKGTWNGVYGMSDPVTSDSIKPNMLFGIGSCTKMYVATVILKLAEEGLLSLDDSLHNWLPNYKNINSNITIRQLLSHTSGVSDYLNENPATFNAIISNFSAYWSPEKILSYVLSPNFAPGTSGRYSNTGYILLGMIIKEATGDTSFTQTLHDKILIPFNLTNTMVDIEEPLVAELAHGWFDYDGDNIREDVFDHPRTAAWSCFWTAGAIMATAEDLCKFTWHNYRGDILNQNSMDAMFNFNPINVGNLTDNYGFGVIKLELLGEELYGHSGDVAWYTAYTMYDPKYDLSISVLVNQDSYDFVFPDQGARYAAIELLKMILNYYKFPYDKVHPFSVNLSSKYIVPGQDSLKITCKVNNPQSNMVQVTASISNPDSSYQMSIPMFDDGLHSDGLSGDLIFGGSLNPIGIEDYFTVSLATHDDNSNYNHILSDAIRFTTAGPVILGETPYTEYVYNERYNRGSINIVLKNEGLTEPAENLKVHISTTDPRVEKISTNDVDFPNLNPGETDTTGINRYQSFDFADGYNPDSTIGNPIHFDVIVYSNDFPYWTDSFEFEKTPTELADEPFYDLPTNFSLKQNYPNPFNPSTTIEFFLPQSAFVTLKIYNTLGEEVTTLVAKELKAGKYQYSWDAGTLSSGVYIYRLKAGDPSTGSGQSFTESRKMILIK